MNWAVRVVAGTRLGTGGIISATHVLTCEHVVKDAANVSVVAADGPRTFNVVDRDKPLDLALLELDSGQSASGAPFIRDGTLVPRALWRGRRPEHGETYVALSTEETATARILAIELRPAPPGSPRVQFAVSGDREGVRHGHSGGPVVEIGAGSSTPRLLGIVRARDETSVDALDNAGVGWFVPTETIAERFPCVAGLVETPVERDPAWKRHWEPRSRGVVRFGEAGLFFSGRADAYEAVRRHLEQGSGLLIVTGLRGCGKSAVLARVVTLGCPRYLTGLGDRRSDAIGGSTPLSRPVDAAVLARGKSAEEVAASLVGQLGLPPSTPDELVAALDGSAAAIVVDALDEAADPAELLRTVVVPLADAGARVVIGGLRRRISPVSVPAESAWVDLSSDRYRDDTAIPEYAERRLRQTGGYSANSAVLVAAAIADRADGLFVVAEAMTKALTQPGRSPVNTGAPDWESQLPGDLTDAFREYLARFGERSELVLAVLHALAHTRGDGFTADPGETWVATANRLRPRALETLTVDDLTDTVRRAGDYLTAGRREDPVRLYHEALAEAIRTLAARGRLNDADEAETAETIARAMDEAADDFVDALIDRLPRDQDAPAGAYASLDRYLLRHLPSHLAERGRLGELLDRPGLLLTADRAAMRSALVNGAATVDVGQRDTRVAVVHALTRSQPTVTLRAAALHAALLRQGAASLADRVGAATSDGADSLPYRLISGPVLAPTLATILDAHTGNVEALAVVEHEGRPLVVSGGGDGAIRSWRLDGEPGPLHQTNAHTGPVRALAKVEHEGQPLLVSGGEDGAIRSWRLDGEPGPLHQTSAHTGPVRALAKVEHEERPLLVSGGEDGAIRSWRLDGEPGPLQQTDAHTGWVDALAVVEHQGQPTLLVSAGGKGAIRSWRLDGEPGPLQQTNAHNGPVRALEVVEHDGQPLLVTGEDGAIRSWRLDGEPGPLQLTDAHSGWVWALATLEHERRPLLVSGGGDGAIRSWRLDGEPGPLQQTDAHTGYSRWVRALAVVEHERRPLLVSAGNDGAIRSWRLDGEPGPLRPTIAHTRAVRALAKVEHEGRPLLLSAGDDGAIRSWRLDGEPGPLQHTFAHIGRVVRALAVVEPEGPLLSGGDDGVIRSRRLDGEPGTLQPTIARTRLDAWVVWALAVVEHDGRPLVVGGSGDGAIRSWRLDGELGPLQQTDAHTHAVMALAKVEHEGRPLIVSGGQDGAIRSWRLDGEPGPLQQTDAHTSWVQALAVVEHQGQPTLLVSAGGEGAIRSWRLDGELGPLQQTDAHTHAVMALAKVEHEGRPLIVSGGKDGAIRSWRLDGEPGPLQQTNAHTGPVLALAKVEHEGQPLLVSAGEDAVLLAHRLDTHGSSRATPEARYERPTGS